MDAFTTAVVLTAALAHAVWNAIVKSAPDPLFSMVSVVVLGGALALPFMPFIGVPAPASWPYILASVVLHTGYYISLIYAYRHGDFAQVYPIARGVSPLIVTVWGVWVVGDVLTEVEYAAVLGIVLGIFVFCLTRSKIAVHDRAAIGYALSTAIFISAYTVVDGVGGRLSGNVHAYMVWLFVLDALPLSIFTLSRYKRETLQILNARWQLSSLGAALSLFAYWLVVWAMTVSPIPLVAALRETSIIAAALIGVLFFKETMGSRRILAAVIICVSIMLLRVSP